MNEFSLTEKYKDASPGATISRIRAILNDLEIVTQETWNRPCPGIYSVRIEITGIQAGANGKGTSEEFALASGLAELMERLQNLVLYKWYSPALLRHCGFGFAPDEKVYTRLDLHPSSPARRHLLLPPLEEQGHDWFHVFTGGLPSWLNDSEPDAGRVFELLFRLDQSEQVTAVPLYNVQEDAVVYMPYYLLRLAYNTNGMAAGNTPQEALVQGISEIFERYVTNRILRDKITPPDIPEQYLKQFPAIYETMWRVQELNPSYQLVFKDCSLGRGFPVVALIVIDQNHQSYSVRFGAHPSVAIALERCLTEIYQGRAASTLEPLMAPFSFDERKSRSLSNSISIFRFGIGHFPAELFLKDPSYSFTEFPNVDGLSNGDLMQRLLGLISTQGWRLLLRDMSFLGFPTFHIIIPGISEINERLETWLDFHIGSQTASAILHSLETAGNSELEAVLRHLRNPLLDTFGGPIVSKIFAAPLAGGNNSSLNIDPLLFIAMASHKIGKPADALAAMNLLLARCRPESDIVYYRCVRDYLGGLAKGLPSDSILPVLEGFYPAPVIEKVIDRWEDPPSIFKGFTLPQCWNCTTCSLRATCHYDRIQALHKKIKDRFAAHPIDQQRLRALFV
jgi:ribosomal protein S12 methylthiotransferase accessory factor